MNLSVNGSLNHHMFAGLELYFGLQFPLLESSTQKYIENVVVSDDKNIGTVTIFTV